MHRKGITKSTTHTISNTKWPPPLWDLPLQEPVTQADIQQQASWDRRQKPDSTRTRHDPRKRLAALHDCLAAHTSEQHPGTHPDHEGSLQHRQAQNWQEPRRRVCKDGPKTGQRVAGLRCTKGGAKPIGWDGLQERVWVPGWHQKSPTPHGLDLIHQQTTELWPSWLTSHKIVTDDKQQQHFFPYLYHFHLKISKWNTDVDYIRVLRQHKRGVSCVPKLAFQANTLLLSKLNVKLTAQCRSVRRERDVRMEGC